MRSAKPGNHLNSSHVINNSDAAIEQCDARCRCKISTALKISVRTVQYQESFQRRTNRGKTRRCHGKKTYSKLQKIRNILRYFSVCFLIPDRLNTYWACVHSQRETGDFCTQAIKGLCFIYLFPHLYLSYISLWLLENVSSSRKISASSLQLF